MWTCSGRPQECDEIARHVDNLRRAAELARGERRERLNAVVQFLGERGERNNVTIRNGQVRAGDGRAALAQTDNEGRRVNITLDLQGIAQRERQRGPGFPGRFTGAGLVAHEGQHGIERRVRGAPTSEVDRVSRERRGYLAETDVYRASGAWGPEIPPSFDEAYIDAGVRTSIDIAEDIE